MILSVLFIVALLIYGICCGVKVNIDKVIERRQEEERSVSISNSRDRALQQIGGYANNRIIEYRPCGFIFAVDKTSGFVNMCNNEAGYMTRVPKEHIVGCEIKKDVIRKGDSNGAYYDAGGIAVGSSTTRERIIIRRYSVVVRLMNESKPAVEFLMIDRPSEVGLSTAKTLELEDKTIYEDSPAFEACRQFADSVNDVVQSISAANRSVYAAPAAPVPPSPAGRIVRPGSDSSFVHQILCPKCGAVQGIDSKFCNQCGCRLELEI